MSLIVLLREIILSLWEGSKNRRFLGCCMAISLKRCCAASNCEIILQFCASTKLAVCIRQNECAGSRYVKAWWCNCDPQFCGKPDVELLFLHGLRSEQNCSSRLRRSIRSLNLCSLTVPLWITDLDWMGTFSASQHDPRLYPWGCLKNSGFCSWNACTEVCLHLSPSAFGSNLTWRNVVQLAHHPFNSPRVTCMPFQGGASGGRGSLNLRSLWKHWWEILHKCWDTHTSGSMATVCACTLLRNGQWRGGLSTLGWDRALAWTSRASCKATET